MKITLIRTAFFDKCTLGVLHINDMELCTLELPYKDNQPMISCIPTGTYKLTKRYSEKYKYHYIVEPTPGRTAILIHKGNTFEHTHGCILVGMALGDVNADGIPDVVRSGEAMEVLLYTITEPCELEII